MNKDDKYKNLAVNDYAFGSYFHTSYKEEFQDINWDFVTFPLFDNPSIGVNAQYCAVYNRTKHPDTAAALALFFFTEEGQKAFHSVGESSVPVLKSAINEDYWVSDDIKDKNYKALVSFPEYCIPGDSESVMSSRAIFGSYFTSLINDHMSGRMNYKDSAKLIEERVNRYLSKE